jgi:hypothetical protein
MTNDEKAPRPTDSSLGLRHSLVIHASTFVILFGPVAASDYFPLTMGLPKTGMRLAIRDN